MLPSHPGPQRPAATATPTETVNPIINPDEHSKIPPTDVVDGAGGVAAQADASVEHVDNECKWYVAYVMPRSEKKVCEALINKPLEAYIPTRWEIHVWRNGRRNKVEQVLIPGVVFVKVSRKRLAEVRAVPNVHSFMMDPARRASKRGAQPFAIIPEAEMHLLKVMVGQEEFNVEFSTQFTLGEHVSILGFEAFGDTAQIVRLPGKNSTYVGVRVSCLGCAYMEVPRERIIKAKASATKASFSPL